MHVLFKAKGFCQSVIGFRSSCLDFMKLSREQHAVFLLLSLLKCSSAYSYILLKASSLSCSPVTGKVIQVGSDHTLSSNLYLYKFCPLRDKFDGVRE